MSYNINHNFVDHNSEKAKIKEIEGKLLELLENVLALKVELTSECKKLESYLKVLSKQIHEIKSDLDYIRHSLDTEIEDSRNEEGWVEL